MCAVVCFSAEEVAVCVSRAKSYFAVCVEHLCAVAFE